MPANRMRSVTIAISAGIGGAGAAILLPSSIGYAGSMFGGLVAGFIASRRGWPAGLLSGVILAVTELLVWHAMQPSASDLARLPAEAHVPPPGVGFQDWLRAGLELPLGAFAGFIGSLLRNPTVRPRNDRPAEQPEA